MKKIKINRIWALTACQLLLASLCSLPLQAQHEHEISVYGGGGLSTLRYEVIAGQQKNGFGGLFGIGYTYFFSPEWGLGTGAELVFYHARYKTDHYRTGYMTVDMDGDAFEFRSEMTGYEEKQRAMMLQIPLMAQFQTGRKNQFYAGLGGKIGIPLNPKYKNSYTFIRNSGYYPLEDYEYTTQEFMGFGTFTGTGSDGGLSLKTAFLLSAEAGVKWKLKDGFSLYTGLYLDYGLTNMYKEKNPPQELIAYHSQHPRDFSVNSILNSRSLQTGTASQSFTDKITPLAAGIKISLAFGKGSRVKAPAYEPPLIDNKIQETQNDREEEAARQLEDERIAREHESRRMALEEARQEEIERQRMEVIKTNIQQPIENYRLSQTALTDGQKHELDEKILLLSENPVLIFYIYGHTCDLGTPETNERIGLQRAEKAKEYILSKGIAEDRIAGIESKRDTAPLVPNINAENRRRNRRVEIKIAIE